ncbi:MAG: hypothetical protein GX126_09380 [Bacteroidales bacterium]|jgi:hypothetical protein|nr:hypothetical protein [Bacteroidales bacterium]
MVLIICLLSLFLSCPEVIPAGGDEFPYPVEKIYDTDEYSAFTDLIRFNNSFYCSFRVGSDHAGGKNGKVRIIRSVDGQTWENVVLLEKEGIDLRDPKLSVTPDNKLMVIMGGSVYENRKLLARKPHVSFSDQSGLNFSDPQRVKFAYGAGSEFSWLWRVTWNGNVGYTIDYQIDDEKEWKIFLMKTTDGMTFENVVQLEVDGKPNEATVRFDKKDNIRVLIRREGGDKTGVLASSQYPYEKWSYEKLDFRLGGPNFIFAGNDKLVIGTRKYQDKVQTHLLVTNLTGDVKKEIILPSGGDTSYPGMLIHKNKLCVSYYSSHEGNSSIYFTRIPLRDLK